ncbi:unnamed protein product [Fusarium fujikuroi]|uniref:Uncharacterized protein n=1 Tax=Fusarium fujikuroi TaxID=5127 RepID=A0A9Q9RF88_FUSFU|nr:unnamed protein product [Fusarium fujikuroi]VZI13420.1 unnamed protein product [Fusarium fujikuroi]
MNSSWEKCATEFDPDPDIAGIGSAAVPLDTGGPIFAGIAHVSRTLPRELDLFRGQGAYDSGQTSQEVLGRGHDMDSDDTGAPIRLGSVTRTAYPV